MIHGSIAKQYALLKTAKLARENAEESWSVKSGCVYFFRQGVPILGQIPVPIPTAYCVKYLLYQISYNSHCLLYQILIVLNKLQFPLLIVSNKLQFPLLIVSK